MNLSYEYFVPSADVTVYRRVKRWSMIYAGILKEELADMLNGWVGDAPRSQKQFLNTPRGTFRIATAGNSDNTTEKALLAAWGVQSVIVDDAQSLGWFFNVHGLDPETARNELEDRLHTRYGGYLS